MQYTICVALDNAAFYNGDDEHQPDYEVSRILFRMTEHMSLHRELPTGYLYDTNGNKVGTAQISGE